MLKKYSDGEIKENFKKALENYTQSEHFTELYSKESLKYLVKFEDNLRESLSKEVVFLKWCSTE